MTGSSPVVIENVYPELDAGRFAVKRELGDVLDVWADMFADGHGLLAARLRYRPCAQAAWQMAPMRLVDNDRWSGSFELSEIGRWQFTIDAWPDDVGSWQSDLRKRLAAGEEVASELLGGAQLIEAALRRAQDSGSEAIPREDAAAADDLRRRSNAIRAASGRKQIDLLLDAELARLVNLYPDGDLTATYPRLLEVWVDRERARFAAWYEFFPRSQGTDPRRSATLQEAARRLADIGDMGFDVVYLPPIHPIGHSHRKGPNNALRAGRGDPGSPWAIGSEAGGHKSVHPELGAIEDFDAFVATARDLGLEVALDYALQCSPDHPYVREHPEWFYHRPDGSIRYAENPPKKYEDIYPLNFYCEDREALWQELKSIIVFWIEHGVRTFRVDNPHTKPFPFWEWLIGEVRREHPDVAFLAEAFTRPKVMKYLAKAGFTQSYTYFTWRNSAAELRDYLTELTQSEVKEYLRGNLFANTPDILHEFLQTGGKPAFQIRLVLAATLSSLYGIYSGFELLEATPLRPGSEEYVDSDKYQIKVRDWDAPGNIKEYVRRVNSIRRQNQALHYYKNLRFQSCDSDQVLVYAKHHAGNTILTAVSTDPAHPQEAWIQAPLDYVGVVDGERYQAEELLTGQVEAWDSLWHPVRLDPAFNPAAIWRLSRT